MRCQKNPIMTRFPGARDGESKEGVLTEFAEFFTEFHGENTIATHGRREVPDRRAQHGTQFWIFSVKLCEKLHELCENPLLALPRFAPTPQGQAGCAWATSVNAGTPATAQ
jgi:hypothetical protein